MVISALSLTAEYRFSTDGDGANTLIVGSLLYVLLDLVVWGAGIAVATSRRERRLLEAAREHAARDAVRAERTRLALELHDVVAHSVTLMVLQAAAAGRLVEQRPAEPVRGALADIEAMGTQTIKELRSLLELLDESAPGTGQRDAATGMPLEIPAAGAAGRPASRRPHGRQSTCSRSGRRARGTPHRAGGVDQRPPARRRRRDRHPRYVVAAWRADPLDPRRRSRTTRSCCAATLWGSRTAGASRSGGRARRHTHH